MIVRLKGIKPVRSKGKTYYYHRKTMTRLPGLPGSAEFTAKLRELEKKGDKEKGKPGTLGQLLNRYRASPEYRNLAPGSQREYGKAIKRLEKIGDILPLVAIDAARVFDLRDKLFMEHSRSTANRMVLFLRLLFAWGVSRKFATGNPAEHVDLIRRPKDAPLVNRRWWDEEVEIVLTEAPPWMRVPVALAVYAGLRESDAVRVTWRAYDGHAFETRQFKTGEPIWVPAHYRLREILDAAPRTSPNIVVGVHGRPMSASSFGSRFFEFLARLRDAGKIEPGLSFHGLRHTCGTRLAEAGCDPPTIAAVLGHSTTKMAEHYSRTADRRGLAGAAIERLEKRDRGRST